LRFVVILLLTVACASMSEPTPAPSSVDTARLALVAYAPADPAVQLGQAETVDAATNQEITFDTPFGRVRGVLVLPPGAGPFPVVLYAHGTGMDADDFVPEGALMAAQGVAAMTVDLPYKPPFPGPLYSDERDRQTLLDAVVVLRRALDAIGTLPALDSSRVGFVGLSLGATAGTQLVAVDHRVKAAVLMSSVARIADYASFETQPATQDLIATGGLDNYLQSMRDVDPITYVGDAAPTELLLQFGEFDGLVPKASADELTAGASQPSETRWYPGTHGLDETAEADRLAWLAARLGLAPS
jgi:dipeptidyl aminopeptidase/acylaminoacyl peptidase